MMAGAEDAAGASFQMPGSLPFDTPIDAAGQGSRGDEPGFFSMAQAPSEASSGHSDKKDRATPTEAQQEQQLQDSSFVQTSQGGDGSLHPPTHLDEHAIPRRPMHRSISVPLSDRMGDLKHPRPSRRADTGPEQEDAGRPDDSASLASSSSSASLLLGAASASLQQEGSPTSERSESSASLAHHILDTLQLPIAHLLHVIPPHLLDASHETLSATSLAMPVTTVEALMEAFRSINWMCDAFVSKKEQQQRQLQQRQDSGLHEPIRGNESSLATSSSTPTTEIVSPSSATSSLTSGLTETDAATSVPESMPLVRSRSGSNANFKTGESTFDVYELAQRAADVVAGQASDKGTELALSWGAMSDSAAEDGHGTASALTAKVYGNEGALRYVLVHTLSRLVELAPPSSVVELELKLPKGKEVAGSTSGTSSLSFNVQALTKERDPLSSKGPSSPCFYPEEGLLQLASAQWHSHSPQGLSGLLTFSALSVVANGDSAKPITSHKPSAYDKQRFLPRLTLAEEPTSSQLSQFGLNELSGKRIALHANPQSIFARNLSRLLRSYGCNIARLALATAPTSTFEEGDASKAERTAIAISGGRPTFVRYESAIAKAGQYVHSFSGASKETHRAQAVLDPVTGVPLTLSDAPNQAEGSTEGDKAASTASHTSTPMRRDDSDESGASATSTIHAESTAGSEMEAFTFLMVDDDIETLQQELLRMRSALPILRNALGQATPHPLSDNDRPALEPNPLEVPALSDKDRKAEHTHAIIFFTSLQNFRKVRDMVQPIIESATHGGTATPGSSLPEVVVIPKPAGPRRVMTALHTALHKPVVDPFFTPIATSPMSPQAWEARMFAKTQDRLKTTPASPRSAPPTATPHKAPTGAVVPRRGPHSPRRNTPSPSRQAAAGGLRISNLPRPDPATLMSSVPHLPTPLRQELSRRESSAGSPPAPPSQRSPSVRTPPQPTTQTMAPPAATPSVRSSTGSSSPMPVEALEYFSETAAKFGGSGSSGVVIQSTDGRPAGIFFQPLPKRTYSNASQHSSRSRASGGHRATSGAGLPSPHVTQEGLMSPRGSLSGRRRSGEKASLPVAAPVEQYARSITEVLEDNAERADNESQNKASTSEAHEPQTAPDASPSSSLTQRRGSVIDKGSSAGKPASSSSNWSGSAHPGAIFSPMVPIGDVLSAKSPPLATPISSAHLGTSIATSSPFHAVSTSTEAISARPLNADTAEKDGTHAAQREPPADVADPVSAQHQSGKETAPGPENNTSHADQPSREPAASQTAVSNAAGTVPGPSAVGSTNARPSAQPQSGLLIGAGFAPTTRRGTANRRPAVREKVLPPIKVLIVEDNPINQRIMKQFMTRKKINFEVAVNGREAVDKWAGGGFHLILMDIQLPVMDGIEATKEIRKQELSNNVGVLPANSPLYGPAREGSSGRLEAPGGATPASAASISNPLAATQTPFQASVIIVALTASVLNSDRVAALAAGCNDFLNKPVSLPWLEKKIIEWGSMQYILLSGAGVFDAERRALRRLQQGGSSSHSGQPGIAAAANNSDLRRAFGRGPDANAKALASRLRLPAVRNRAALAEAANVQARAPELSDGAVNSANDDDHGVDSSSNSRRPPTPTVQPVQVSQEELGQLAQNVVDATAAAAAGGGDSQSALSAVDQQQDGAGNTRKSDAVAAVPQEAKDKGKGKEGSLDE